MRGLAVGYDDVVDVNLKVWGDEWEQRLGRLTSTMRGPGNVVRAWGHPVWVRGDVTIDGRSAILRALDVARGPVRRAPSALSPRRRSPPPPGCRCARGTGSRRSRPRRPPTPPRTSATASGSTTPSRTRGRSRSSCCSRSARSRRSSIAGLVFWRFGREPRDRLRPRVRAGAADGDRAGARADPAAPGRRGRLVRVHGDALRPHPTRPLHGRADDDRAEHLGRAPDGAGLRPRALRRARRST